MRGGKAVTADEEARQLELFPRTADNLKKGRDGSTQDQSR
jgi:hypothetical protein